jgi:hypothetical protein
MEPKIIIYADPESNVIKAERSQQCALASWKETMEYDPHQKKADTQTAQSSPATSVIPRRNG